MAKYVIEDTTLTKIAEEIRAKSGKSEKLTPAEMAVEISGLSDFKEGIIEFNQMNDSVMAYLAAADEAYTDDNGDTTSVIATYETAEGDEDRPLGYPLTATEGDLYVQNEDTGKGWKLSVGTDAIRSSIYNTTPGNVSQYLVKDADGNLLENGRIKPTGKVRMIRFCGYNRNCRDLGGWNCDGGSVKYGLLFRSGVVASSETWIDQKIGQNLNIRHHIDLRGDEEASYITESTLGAKVRYVRIPINLYYSETIDTAKTDYANVKKVLRTIIEAAIHNEPVIYNCSLGRDRTGTITFMILALLGVARADIDKDYELTSFSAMDTPAYRTSASYRTLETYLSTFEGATLRDKVVWWFIKAGFSLAELNAFRAAITDGTPDELNAADFVTTYSVMYYLTNCKTSNDAASAEESTAYATVLTVEGSYELSTVKVTMGGVDVTADVYADGKITIPAVTGDVVITATAVQGINYTNQIPISTDTDGSIFNSVGYMAGYRINSSGALTAETGCYVTGFIPCVVGDVVRFAYFNLDSTSSGLNVQRLAFYDASKTKLATPYWSEIFDAENSVYDENGALTQMTVPSTYGSVAFMRIGCFFIDNKSIITVNEEIE